jgi:hypothetical protein
VDTMDKAENMLRSRVMIGGSPWPRSGVVLLCAVILTGCASAVAFRVPKWNYDYTRIPSIMEQRTSTYRALFLRSM